MAQRVPPTVGFIGLGRMGKPMALNLVRSGLPVVVHSRSPGPVEELVAAGATAAAYPGEVASLADVVCTCLPDLAASETIYLADNGLVVSARPTSVFIESSTIAPSMARRIAAAARAKGAAYVDAPISGGAAAAEEGTLTMLVGGEADDVERAMPTLLVMGGRIHHVGPTGQGNAVKLISQLLISVHLQAACEALALGKKVGVDPSLVLEIVSKTFGNSAALERAGPMIMQGVESGDFGSRAPIRLLAKDIDLADDLATELGLPLPLTHGTRQAINTAMERGLGETDMTALITLLITP